MNIKKIIATGIMALGALASFAAPTVTDVTTKQRYPWNGLVDITCKVTGISGTTNGIEFVVASVNQNSDIIHYASNFWVVQGGTNSTDRIVRVNGNYKLLWDARADLGQGLYSNIVVRVTMGKACGKVQLWESGPYWATMNIGATKPAEYGYYFWWGDIVGYGWNNNKWVASDGSASNFSFTESNTPTYDKSSDILKSQGWITADGILAPTHDAAHVHWGGAWRMPTGQELDDLNNKCDWTWTTMNGVQGHLVKGKGTYASVSIFLPAAGFGGGTSFLQSGLICDYWSSVPHEDYDSYASMALDVISNRSRSMGGFYRYIGCSIRPVQGLVK